MRGLHVLGFVAVGLLVLTSCSGESSGRDGYSSLITVAPEPDGNNCANGGQRVDAGLDDGADGGVANNGMLEPGEITSTEYVCNGTDGGDGADGVDGRNSLVAVREACGQNECPEGGLSIDSGLDANDDGELQPGEVTNSALVCGGTLPPPVLVGGDFLTADGWTVTGAAEIDTEATGNDDPGEAIISPTAACAGDTVGQTISFPSSCASQPLALQVATRATGIVLIPGVNGAVRLGGALQLGRARVADPNYVSDVMCVGAAAYGGSTAIELAHPVRPGPNCSTDARNGRAYDNVTLVAAPGLCPLPGVVLNGGFDDGVSGWRTTRLEGGGTFTAVVDDGLQVARLSAPAGPACPNIIVNTEASVPVADDVAKPALEFRWRSAGLGQGVNSSTTFEATVYNGPNRDGDFLAARPRTDVDSPTYTTERLCLGSTASGIVVNVTLQVIGTGTCANTPAADVYVDDFRIINLPSCT